MRAQVTGR